jgi:arginyl-tRNA synthetase
MVEKILAEKTAEAVLSLYGQKLDPSSVGVEKTKKEISGDFTIVVFPLTRISRKSPEVTANEIGEYLKREVDAISAIGVIKGFLNITLSDSSWLEFLRESSPDPEFGLKRISGDKPVLVEYSSPNTNKPLHLGHIRNNLLGYSVAEILKANGHKVIRLNLVNDRGIHICKSMLSYMKWGNGETPASSGEKPDHLIGKYYVLFDKHYREEVKELVAQGIAEEDAGRKAPLMLEAQEILRKWEAKDPSVMELWQTMNGWAYEGFEETYGRLGVAFDSVQYESQTYIHGKEIVDDGLANGVFAKRDDGSVWVDLRDEGLDEKLLLRSDGTSVYMTQDLGTARLREEEFHPEKMVYVVGNEQNYHFDVLKRVLKKAGYEWAGSMYHLSYGMVELPHGKMKSREGTVVDADDLMDEMEQTAGQTTRELGKVEGFPENEAKELFRMIGLGALKYFILKVDPKKNMLFDPAESIDFNGNTGPFIQYTHARIRSLLRKAADAGFSPDASVSNALPEGYMMLPVERNVIKILYQFPAMVRQAGEEFSPALIANYVYELAKEFNQFYQEIPVLKENRREIVLFRLILSSFTGDVIRRAMSLLGIRVPDRM